MKNTGSHLCATTGMVFPQGKTQSYHQYATRTVVLEVEVALLQSQMGWACRSSWTATACGEWWQQILGPVRLHPGLGLPSFSAPSCIRKIADAGLSRPVPVLESNHGLAQKKHFPLPGGDSQVRIQHMPQDAAYTYISNNDSSPFPIFSVSYFSL